MICLLLVVSAVVALVDAFSAHERAAELESAVEDYEIVGDEQELLVTGYCNCGKCVNCKSKCP